MDPRRRQNILTKLAAYPGASPASSGFSPYTRNAVPSVYQPGQSPQEQYMQGLQADRIHRNPMASGAAESLGSGVGAITGLATGLAAKKADDLLGNYPSAGLKAVGSGLWQGADKLQRAIYGDKFIEDYNRGGGMAGAVGSALGAKGRKAAGEAGLILGDATALVGLGGLARTAAQGAGAAGSGLAQAGRQAGNFVKTEITNAADTLASMGPRPAYAMASASSAPAAAAAPNLTPIPGLGTGLQRSRLNSMLASGQLSPAGRATAQERGWFDPKKHVEGIERGNLSLAERYGVKLTRNPEKPSTTNVGAVAGAETDVNKMDAGLRGRDQGWSQYFLRRSGATPDPLVNIDPTAPASKYERFAGPFDPEQMPGPFRRASSAITTRHELDEVRSLVRPGRRGEPSTFRTYGQSVDPATGQMAPTNTAMQLPNARGGYGYHAHPSVISQEAANVNMMDDSTRNILSRLRSSGGSDEARVIYQALPESVRQAIPTTRSGFPDLTQAFLRMWNQNPQVRRQIERGIWESPANRAGQAQYIQRGF